MTELSVLTAYCYQIKVTDGWKIGQAPINTWQMICILEYLFFYCEQTFWILQQTDDFFKYKIFWYVCEKHCLVCNFNCKLCVHHTYRKSHFTEFCRNSFTDNFLYMNLFLKKLLVRVAPFSTETIKCFDAYVSEFLIPSYFFNSIK